MTTRARDLEPIDEYYARREALDVLAPDPPLRGPVEPRPGDEPEPTE